MNDLRHCGSTRHKPKMQNMLRRPAHGRATENLHWSYAAERR